MSILSEWYLTDDSIAIILPSFSKQLLRDLELKALGLLQFSSGNNMKNIVSSFDFIDVYDLYISMQRCCTQLGNEHVLSVDLKI